MQGSAIGSAINPGASHGYMSGGLQTDNESARLSNVQTYKFNQNNNKSTINRNGAKFANSMNIRKINPNTVMLKPVSRGDTNSIGGTLAQSRASNPVNTMNPKVSQTIPGVGEERSVLGPDQYMSGGGTSVMSAGSGLPGIREAVHRTVDGSG